MKYILLALLFIIPNIASAEHPYWTTIRTKPVYETHVFYDSHYICDDRYTGHRRHPNSHGIVGGVLGAAVGRQFGRGRGRDASTVIGAVIGYNIERGAHYNHNRRHRNYYEREQSCYYQQSPRYEREIVGYRVTYRTETGRTVTRFEPYQY